MPAAVLAGFFVVELYGSGLSEVGRAGDGGDSGSRLRPHPDGGLHERRSVSQDCRNGVRNVLQPLAPQVVAEGRDLWPPPGGERNLDGLRSGRRAGARRGAGSWSLPQRLSELFLPAARKWAMGRIGSSHL